MTSTKEKCCRLCACTDKACTDYGNCCRNSLCSCHTSQAPSTEKEPGYPWEEEIRSGAGWTQDGAAMLKRVREIVAQAEIDAAIDCAEHEKHAVAAYKEELMKKANQMTVDKASMNHFKMGYEFAKEDFLYLIRNSDTGI